MGTAAVKLTTHTQVSVDGVMQANGPSEEDRRAGFERDGWAMGHFDSEAMAFVDEVYQRAGAFLFGRRIYEIFAPYWGTMDLGSSPVADALNTKPKYVASATLTDPQGHHPPGLPPGQTPAVRNQFKHVTYARQLFYGNC